MTSDLEFTARPNEPVVQISRLFRAPVDVVFDAWITREHLCRWWAPPGASVVECNVDLRVGGVYRYVLQAPEGGATVLDGHFVELDPPHRLVTNFARDSAPDDQVVEVTTFTESPGGAVVRIVSLHRSCAARDAQLADGSMAIGMADQFARLDEVLARSASV